MLGLSFLFPNRVCLFNKNQNSSLVVSLAFEYLIHFTVRHWWFFGFYRSGSIQYDFPFYQTFWSIWILFFLRKSSSWLNVSLFQLIGELIQSPMLAFLLPFYYQIDSFSFAFTKFFFDDLFCLCSSLSLKMCKQFFFLAIPIFSFLNSFYCFLWLKKIFKILVLSFFFISSIIYILTVKFPKTFWKIFPFISKWFYDIV